MELLNTVRSAWEFTGLLPRTILEANAFGNLLVEDTSGCIWRICPDELSCAMVASTVQEFQALRKSRNFGQDWAMGRLVELRCFCLKIPAVLGGAYERHNLATISLSELIAASGHIARQIKDLPDGAKVEFRITE